VTQIGRYRVKKTLSFVMSRYVVVKELDANRKVAGSVPNEVIFLNLPNPSDRTMP
jgi:hypothetical protein